MLSVKKYLYIIVYDYRCAHGTRQFQMRFSR